MTDDARFVKMAKAICDGSLSLKETREMVLRFFVTGKPVPKGRPRVTRYGQAYTPAATVAWEETVGWAAKEAIGGDGPSRNPLSVHMKFYGARKNADLDNLVKCVLDGMNGIIYEDDRQVRTLLASTWPEMINDLVESGVQISVRSLI